MEPIQPEEELRPVTLGDICEALADGRIDAEMKDGYYYLDRSDVLRFARSYEREEPIPVESINAAVMAHFSVAL